MTPYLGPRECLSVALGVPWFILLAMHVASMVVGR